jgi:hypothetical protein
LGSFHARRLPDDLKKREKPPQKRISLKMQKMLAVFGLRPYSAPIFAHFVLAEWFRRAESFSFMARQRRKSRKHEQVLCSIRGFSLNRKRPAAIFWLLAIALAAVATNFGLAANETDDSPRVDTIFLVDVSKSALSTVYEALRDEDYAKKERTPEGDVTALRKKREADMLTFLSLGMKPRNWGRRNVPILYGTVKPNEKVTNNLVFQSVEKMSQIAEAYKCGRIIIIPFVNGPVELGDLATPRFEFDFDRDPANRTRTRSDLLSFLSPAVNDKWHTSGAWRGLLAEAVCKTNDQLRVKNINLACRQAFDELVVGQAKADRPYLVQFIAFTDGDQPNRLSELGQMLTDFRNFCALTNTWFEYHECCFKPSFELSEVARESQKMIKESGFFVEDSFDFTRSIRFYGPQKDSINAELSAASSGLRSRSSIIVPFPYKIVGDDGGAASGKVNFSLEPDPNVTVPKFALTYETFQVSSLSDSLNLEINVKDLQQAFELIKSSTEIDLHLNWSFVPEAKAKSDDFVSRSILLKIVLTPPPPQLLIRVRALKNQTAGSPDSDPLIFQLDNIDPSREAIAFQADFSAASRDSHLIVNGEANKSDIFLLNDGKNYLDLPSPSGEPVSFSVSANAKPGQTRTNYTLDLQAKDSNTMVIPHQIVLNATFRKPSVRLDFYDANSAPMPAQPQVLDWHEVMEHHARRGVYKNSPPGEEFAVNVPANTVESAGVTLSLDEAAKKAFTLVRLDQGKETPFADGGLVTKSDKFRIRIRSDLKQRDAVDHYEGHLVIESSSDALLLNDSANPVTISLSVAIKRVDTLGN